MIFVAPMANTGSPSPSGLVGICGTLLPNVRSGAAIAPDTCSRPRAYGFVSHLPMDRVTPPSQVTHGNSHLVTPFVTLPPW